jgi:hypothetical protein
MPKPSDLKGIADKIVNENISGSGGGAGGGTATPSNPNLDAYTRVLQGMVNSGSYGDANSDLLTQLEGLYGGAQTDLQGNYDTATAKLKELMGGAGTTINSSMDQLKTALEAQQNPYQGFVAKQAQAVPGLNELLGSQGVSTDPVANMATALNAGNAGQAGAFQNLADTMKAMYAGNQQGMIGDVAQQRTDAQTDLANRGAAYGQQLSTGFSADKNALAKQLLGEKSKINADTTGAQGDLMAQLLAAIKAGGSLDASGLNPFKKKPVVPGVVAPAVAPSNQGYGIDFGGINAGGVGTF